MATRLSSLDQIARPAPRKQHVIVSRVRGISATTTCNAYGVKAVLEGEETYRFQDQTRVVRAGEFIVVPPGRSFEVGICRNSTAVGLCIDLPVGAVEAERGDVSDHPDAVFELDGDTLGPLLTAVWDASHRKSETPDLTVHLGQWLSKHGGAMGRLNARKPSTRRDLFARVERARQYLHSNTHRQVSLEELANFAHLSPFHLNRCFREVTGTPPARYHRELRLAEAAGRLQDGVTATSLAHELGYSDLPTFTRAFRRVHGAPPSRFARR